MKKHLPGLVIFITGFATMVFEIGGARVLGPYFGTSVFVWTSLIGIIMGSLSAGYWLGGLISVKRSEFFILSIILSLSALFVLISTTGNMYILDRVLKYVPGFKLRTVVGAILLFGPASLFFGMVLPYSIKLGVRSVSTSGGTVGNLYALSTVGSILGTFAAGFYLIPVFGFANVLFVIAAILLFLSSALLITDRNKVSIIINLITVCLLCIFWIRYVTRDLNYIDVDTKYNRVIIYNTVDKATGRPIKMLKVNDEYSSAMFLDGEDDLVFEVLKYYRLVEHFVPEFKSALMVGGSGYAFPKDYLKNYPGAKLDVVEIDPGLTELAKKHFELKDNPDLRIFHEDGRTFLNRNQQTYDAIFMDAYKSMITIPYQLTTVEAVQKIHESLNPGGAIFANIISSLNPEYNYFLKAELATYKSVFEKVLLFAVQYPDPNEDEMDHFQNIMLVGLKNDNGIDLSSSDSLLQGFLSHHFILRDTENSVILTDEYAPVEYFSSRALK